MSRFAGDIELLLRLAPCSSVVARGHRADELAALVVEHLQRAVRQPHNVRFVLGRSADHQRFGGRFCRDECGMAKCHGKQGQRDASELLRTEHEELRAPKEKSVMAWPSITRFA